MKKKIAKMATLMMVLCMTFSATVFAAEPTKPLLMETQQQSDIYPGNINIKYTDQFGISRTLTGKFSCDATIMWEEGYYGWVSSAEISIDKTTMAIDGDTSAVTTVAKVGGVTGLGNFKATQVFKINSSAEIQCSMTVDGHGIVTTDARMN